MNPLVIGAIASIVSAMANMKKANEKQKPGLTIKPQPLNPPPTTSGQFQAGAERAPNMNLSAILGAEAKPLKTPGAPANTSLSPYQSELAEGIKTGMSTQDKAPKTPEQGGGMSWADTLSTLGAAAEAAQAARGTPPTAPRPSPFGSAATVGAIQPTSASFGIPRRQPQAPTTLAQLLQAYASRRV